MHLFKKPPPITTPPAVMKFRKETHAAAKDASKELSKLNSIMGNGITLKIYHAIGGKHGHQNNLSTSSSR